MDPVIVAAAAVPLDSLRPSPVVSREGSYDSLPPLSPSILEAGLQSVHQATNISPLVDWSLWWPSSA